MFFPSPLLFLRYSFLFWRGKLHHLVFNQRPALSVRRGEERCINAPWFPALDEMTLMTSISWILQLVILKVLQKIELDFVKYKFTAQGQRWGPVTWQWEYWMGSEQLCSHKMWQKTIWGKWNIVHAQLLSCVWILATLWTVVHRDSSPHTGSSVHSILQARILEWDAIPTSRGSSWPKNRTHVSYDSCISRWFLYH